MIHAEDSRCGVSQALPASPIIGLPACRGDNRLPALSGGRVHAAAFLGLRHAEDLFVCAPPLRWCVIRDERRGRQAVPTPKKAALIEELTEKLQRSKAAVLVQTQGLTVAEITDLRRKLSSSAGELKVAKNTLLRIASSRARIDDLADVLQGPTTIAFGYEDEVGVARAITDYVRTSRVVTIKGGILGKRRLSVAEVESLARAPTRPQLQGQVFGALQGPVAMMANLINAPLRDLVYILQARADQLGGGAGAAS